MENLVKQISMRVFGVKDENKAQTSRVIRDHKILSRRTRSSKRDSWKGQNWGRRQRSLETSHDHDNTEGEEFRTAVAAAAFAINSIESKRQEVKQDRRSKSRKSSSEIIETSSRSEVNEDLPNEASQPAAPTTVSIDDSEKVSGTTISSTASIEEANSSLDIKTSQKEPQTRLGEADIWEKTEMEKIKERFMKVKERISGWEQKKKAKAKNKLTRKEGEIEWKRARALQDFVKKMETIEKVSTGARSHNDNNQKNEEMRVKEKANMIRSTGKIQRPMFLCC